MNKTLLRAGLRRAERDAYDPTGCRSDLGLCFPSMVVDLAGGQWADEEGSELGAWLLAEDTDPDEHVLRIVHPHDRARRLLELPDDIRLDDAIDLGRFRQMLRRQT